MPIDASTSFEIRFPVGFDEHGWEYEAKGRLAGVVVQVGRASFTLTFYDPVRLDQDVTADLVSDAVFFEANLVVVSAVTRSCIEAAVASLVVGGALRDTGSGP